MEDNKRANKMNLLGMTKQSNTIKLYHGSPNRIVHPTYGMGKDTHDYGRGFYLTPDIELAKEWAMCREDTSIGWLHSYELDLKGLSILNFEEIDKQRAFYWATELLQHREPDDKESRGIYYDDYKAYLLKHFALRSSDYDVVAGWRADDSYFRIVSSLMNDDLNIHLLEQSLRVGQLGIQYCCRSEKSFKHLRALAEAREVSTEYRERYLQRDRAGRKAFDELLNSSENKYHANRFTMHDILSALIRNGGRP